MRIVKLSSGQGFEDSEDVREFFEETLPDRFDGRFRMTAGRIRADGLAIGEMVLFSKGGQVYYIARAASERMVNDDKWAGKLPFYFEVDRASIHPVNISLYEVEERYRAATGQAINLAQSRGWPEIKDQAFEDSLWRELVGRGE